jgi:hypothetical protein
MVRVSLGLLASAVILAFAVPSTSAQTVKAAPKCANGLPEWANDAFAGRRGSAAFRCDQPLSSQQAAPKAKQQRPATQARAKQAPASAAVEPVATKEASASASPTTDPAKSTEQATKSAEPATKAGTKPLCRRYLASTGQTVEVPCS